jgi:hypothetical protein
MMKVLSKKCRIAGYVMVGLLMIGCSILQNNYSGINEKFPKDNDGSKIDETTDKVVKMNKIRYALYHAFIFAQYGRLGKNNRIKLGKCVEVKIKELFPNPGG